MNDTYIAANYSLAGNSVVIAATEDDVVHQMDCSSGSAFIRMVADIWVSFPLVVLGVFGNIIAFIVLCSYRHKLSTTILLQALAVIDTMILLSIFLLRTLHRSHDCYGIPVEYKEVWKVLFQILFPLTFALRMMDTWMITLLTFDRWIAVCKPLHAQQLCRLGATYRRIAIIIILSLIFTIPRILESDEWGVPENINPQWRNNQIYIYVYQIGLFFIFMYLVPTIALIVLNLKLLLSLRINDPTLFNRRHSKHGSSNSPNGQHRSITVIVISIVVIYFVCNILVTVSHILFSLEFCFPGYRDSIGVHRRRISNVSNMFLTFNSASHFFIYCICSRNFRTVMYRTFGCRRRISFFRNTSRASYSNGTLDTSTSLIEINEPLSGKNGHVTDSL